MSLREGDVDQMWKKLGWSVDLKKRDVTATLVVNGAIVLRSRRSHGSGKLDGVIPQKIRGQMKLNESQFQAAYQCPLQRDEYFAILRLKGVIPE